MTHTWERIGIVVLLATLVASCSSSSDQPSSIQAKKVANLTDTLAQNEIFEPRDVVSDEDGSVYVFDNGEKQIHVLDNDFTVQNAFGREGPGPGEFERAVSNLQFTPDRDLVALEKWEQTVHFFSPEGDYHDSFRIQKKPTTEGTPADRGFGIPLDIAVDNASNVYLTDRVWYYSRDLVHVFDRSGTYVRGELAQESFETLREAREKWGSVEREQRYIGQMMNERQRKIAVDHNDNVVLGHRGEYILAKYNPEFDLKWKTEMDFSPVKTAHAYKIDHMGTVGYTSAMGEGAVADIAIGDDNHIFVSVGCFDGRLDEDKRDQLSHWIDVFSEEGEHIARLLEDELPPLPIRRGYRIDVQGSRLLVLGETEMWAYEIVRDS